MAVLVTGCGRSGTKYAAWTLNRLGVIVGHEKLRRDGVISWFMAVDAETVPFGEARRGRRFDRVLHQVRHPLDVIRSAATLHPDSWRYISRRVPVDLDEPIELRGARYWVLWNEVCEAQANWRFRVERLEDEIGGLLGQFGRERAPRRPRLLPNDVNTRRFGRALSLHDRLCHLTGAPFDTPVRRMIARPSAPVLSRREIWETIKSRDHDLARALHGMAVRYGYDDL